MEISQLLLARLLFNSFLLGIATGIFFDANRIIRVFFGASYTKKRYRRLYEIGLPITHRKIKMGEERGLLSSLVLNVGDFLCVIFASFGIIILCYSYNNGRFRFFCVIGLLAGFALYRLSVGKIFITLFEPMAFILKYSIVSIFTVFGYPIVKFVAFVGEKVKKIIYLYSFTLEKKKDKLYNIKEKVYSPTDSGGCSLKDIQKYRLANGRRNTGEQK